MVVIRRFGVSGVSASRFCAASSGAISPADAGRSAPLSVRPDGCRPKPGTAAGQTCSLRSASRGVVLDPEYGRVGVRSNVRDVNRRSIGARRLHRRVATLDEHATVRKARPVGHRAAVRLHEGHGTRLHGHDDDARVVMPAGVAARSEVELLDPDVGRIFGLELDPVAVGLDCMIEVCRGKSRRRSSRTGRSLSNGRDNRCDHRDSEHRSSPLVAPRT
jgi:hypothetical protein